MGDYDAKKKAADEKAAKELKDLRDNFSLSKLLDDQSIIDEDEKEIPLSHFKQEGMITGIYFSAHWCGPCVAFTPKLVEKYDALVKDGKKLTSFLSLLTEMFIMLKNILPSCHGR